MDKQKKLQKPDKHMLDNNKDDLDILGFYQTKVLQYHDKYICLAGQNV